MYIVQTKSDRVNVALDGRRIRGIRRISRFGGPGDVVLLHDTVPVPAYKEMIIEQNE